MLVWIGKRVRSAANVFLLRDRTNHARHERIISSTSLTFARNDLRTVLGRYPFRNNSAKQEEWQKLATRRIIVRNRTFVSKIQTPVKLDLEELANREYNSASGERRP